MKKSYMCSLVPLGWIFVIAIISIHVAVAAVSDGLPLEWREAYFGTNNVDAPQAAATADPDGDGAINYQEYLAGTNPTDASSIGLRPASVSTVSGSVRGTNDGPLATATYYAASRAIKDRQGRIWLTECTASGFYTSIVGSHRIRVIDTNGMVTTVAGASEYGLLDGPGSQARFQFPTDIAFDSKGNAYVTDCQNHRIRKIDTNWVVSTYAGSSKGLVNGNITNAQFSLPYGLEIDAADNMYVADFDNLVIRKITPDGIVSTYAGGTRGFLDGDRLSARFNSPNDLALDSQGNLWVSDWHNGAIRKIDTNGMVTTVVADLIYSEQITVDSRDDIYAYHSVGGNYRKLEKLTAQGRKLWALNDSGGFQDGDISTALFGSSSCPVELTNGTLLVVDGANNRLRLIHQSPLPLLTFSPGSSSFSNSISVALSTPLTNGVIRYTVDGTPPTTNAPAYAAPVTLIVNTVIRAAVYVNDVAVSLVTEANYQRLDQNPPIIASTSTNITALPGRSVTLTAEVSGSSPVYYQWQLNGSNLPAATSAVLVIDNISLAQAGQYAMVASNPFGCMTGVVANVTVTVPTCVPVAGGLVGWWPAEGTTEDFAGGANGILKGGATFATGLVGQAFTFDGIDDEVTIPASSNLNVTSLTIEGWIFPYTVTRGQPLVDYLKLGVANGVNFWIGLGSDGNMNFPETGALLANIMPAGGGNRIIQTPAGIPSNQWTHVAVTYDQTTGEACLFGNGTLLTSKNLGVFTPKTDLPIGLGARETIGHYAGKMDEFAIYNRALSGSEITAIYQAGSAGKCGPQIPPAILSASTNLAVAVGSALTLTPVVAGTSPMSYQWQLNGTNIAGANANSLHFPVVTLVSAGEYSLVLSNAYGMATGLIASVSVFVPACTPQPDGLVGWWKGENNTFNEADGRAGALIGGTSYADGIAGRTFAFDGINDEVVVAASSNLNVTSVTVETWINTTTLAKAQPVLEYFQLGVINGLNFWINVPANGYADYPAPGTLYVNLPTAQGVNHILCSTTNVIVPNAWQHVALTYDYASGNARLYVNGAVVATANLGSITPRTEAPLHIGGIPTTSFWFSGKMDELSIYNRALSANEILAIFKAGSNGKCGPQVPPQLPAEPLSLVAGLGGPFTLNANASGTAPLVYQWLFNGTNLDGATGGSLTIPNARLEDSGAYAVIVSNAFGMVTGVVANVTVQPLPPTIVTQPASQSVAAGAPVVFAVGVSGTPPFAYQWYFEGEPLLNATNATLSIPTALGVNAGAYQVAISNELNTVLSTSATLVVTYPPAKVMMPNLTAASGRQVTVPVLLVANGNENALQFSVQFSTSRLTLLGVQTGADAGMATLLANTNQAASDRVGLVLSLPAGRTFAFGTQEVARLVFQAIIQPNNATTSLNFYDSPTIRQLSDAQAQVLPASYTDGSIQLAAADYEADVAPRGATDRRITVTDWVQIGRFVAALDTPVAGAEFQRADCAPRSEGGNGILSATDWVQAGRYAAGLDPLAVADGPTNFETAPNLVRTAQIPSASNGGACTVSVAATSVVVGEVNRFQITLTASGSESALSFTLRFDPAQLSYVSALAAQSTLHPSLNLNTDQLAAGKLGVALTLPTGTTYAVGEQQVVNADFLVAPATRGPITLDFDSTLITREVSDSEAQAVTSASWQGKTMKVALPAPQMALSASGNGMTFRWPASLGETILEAADDLGARNWMPVDAARIEAAGQIQVELPMDAARKFYRLRSP